MSDRFMGLLCAFLTRKIRGEVIITQPWESICKTSTRVVTDGRTILETLQMDLLGFNYMGIGRLAAERAAEGGTL